jgi:hypothetical protein
VRHFSKHEAKQIVALIVRLYSPGRPVLAQRRMTRHFGRYRETSGHRADTVNVLRMTQAV